MGIFLRFARIDSRESKLPFELLGLHSPFIFLEVISVIISLPITPNEFLGFKKRNSQETLHHPVLSVLGKITQSCTQNSLRELIGVINFTSVTPDNSWGINCVILEGPMVVALTNRGPTIGELPIFEGSLPSC